MVRAQHHALHQTRGLKWLLWLPPPKFPEWFAPRVVYHISALDKETYITSGVKKKTQLKETPHQSPNKTPQNTQTKINLHTKFVLLKHHEYNTFSRRVPWAT